MFNNNYNNRMLTGVYNKKDVNVVDSGKEKLSLVYTSSRDKKKGTVKGKNDIKKEAEV